MAKSNPPNEKITKGYRDLRVWEESYRLAHRIYDFTDQFPREHRFELSSQLNRAALSIPTNIAEGCGAIHKAEYVQFLNIALRSANEVEMLVLFAKDRKLIEPAAHRQVEQSCIGIKRMLTALMKSLNGERLS